MKTRILSGLIMVPLLAVVFFGGPVLILATFLIGIIGIREFYSAFNKSGVKASYAVAYTSILLLYFINLFFSQYKELYMFWLVITLLMSFLYMFKIEKRDIRDGMVTFFGIVYVIFLSFHVVLIDQSQHFSILIWLVFITAFGSDISAYFTGMLIGKHKLCPNISPKKTIEGAVGGVLGSVLLSGVFGYFVCPHYLIHCLVIGLIASIMSQLGDLSASIYKRKLDVKDYGNLIPGHGGILDRFDSVIFTAPTVYYYIVIITILEVF